MAQRPIVPQFGNWESEDNVPYTIYFDKARKGKNGGKMINPNDPQENPDMFPPSAQAPPSRASNRPEEPIGRRAVRPTPESRSRREDGDPRQFTEAPPRNDNVGRRGGTGHTGLTHQNRGGHGSGFGRPARQSAGSEHSIDRSPLHPQYQAKIVGKGSGSPSWESKHLYDSYHGTPGRSRLKPVSRGDESPDKGAAVPRFGEWENNPSSGDNYTHIFNKVREEKITGSPMVSNMSTDPSYANRRKQNDHDKYKSQSSCFPCFKK